jgi:metal transporter CNNM
VVIFINNSVYIIIFRIIIFILAPITYPIAWLLEAALGNKHGVIYRHAELRELVNIHGEDQSGPLSKDEVELLRAVLDLRTKTVIDIMTNLDDVFMLSSDTVLDKITMELILYHGHSRVPVFSDYNE